MAPIAEPNPTDKGMASAAPETLAEQTWRAWADFRGAIEAVDVDADTRVKRRRARTIIAKVGDWPESRQLPEILADAREGNLAPVDQDAIDDRVIAAHGDDDRDDLLAAIDRARDSVFEWINSDPNSEDGVDKISTAPVGSPLGTLPVLTYLHAAAFQLAIAGRDMQRAGAEVPDSLLLAGLHALVDTTGALAARMDIDTTFAVVTPIGSVVTVAANGGWTVTRVDSDEVDPSFPGLEGQAGLLLDMAAGRRNPVTMLTGNAVKVREMSSLMRLAPIAQANPGLPGGPVLRKSAAVLGRFAR